MTMHARLADLVGRCNRKTLAIAAVCVLVVAVVAAQANTQSGSGTPQAPALTGALGFGAGGSDGAAITADTGAATGLDGTSSQPAYTPSVDDLLPSTVSYDEGTGDQLPYIPVFDSGE